MPVKIELEISEDFMEMDRFKKIIPPFLDLIAQDLYANLIKKSPVDHGRLKGAWNRSASSDTGFTYQNATYYAIFQNDGTYSYGPSKRKPKTKEVGGIKPKRFVENSIIETGQKMRSFLNIVISEVD